MGSERERPVLAAVVFVVLFAQVLLYPGIDALVATLGASARLEGSTWFLAAEFAAFVVFAGFWGLASDVAGRRTPFVAAGAVLGAIGYLLLAVLPGFFDLPFAAILALRIFQGAATIGAFSLAITMLMDLDGGHGRNMGAAGIAIGLGTALGAPIGGQLYEVGPLVPLYVASGVLLLAGAATVLVVDRAPSSDRRGIADYVAGIRATPALGLPYAFGFVDRLTAGFIALVGTLYFRTAFDLSPGETGITLALFFAPFALLQYPLGVLSDRTGRVGPMVIGSSLYGAVVIGVGFAPSLLAAQVTMVGLGVLGALMAPATMALVTDVAGRTDRGIAMAGFNVAGSVGFLAGVVVGGTVAGAYGYTTAFLVVGAMEVVVAFVAVPFLLRLDVDRIATFEASDRN